MRWSPCRPHVGASVWLQGGLGAARLVRGERLLSEAAAVGEDERVRLERHRSEQSSVHTHGTCTCVPEQRRMVQNVLLLQAVLMRGREARTPSRNGRPLYELVYCNSAATSTPAAAGTEESTKLRDAPSLVMLTSELAKLDQVSTAARSFGL